MNSSNQIFLSDNGLLDIKFFEKQNVMYKNDEYKIHKISIKKKKEAYMAKIYNTPFKDYYTENINDFFREVNILIKLNHPSILKFVGLSLKDFQKKENPIIITEYPSNVLQNIFEKRKSKIFLDDTNKLIIIYGVASAMSYLHSHNIIYKNLCFKNIFLDNNLFPKIYGFNFSKEISNSISKDSRIKGYIYYLAPEVITSLQYSFQSDVYSFACFVYQLLTDNEPFESKTLHELIQLLSKGIRPKINISVPQIYVNLIEKCWSQDPKKRPMFDDIINDLKSNFEQITSNINKEKFLNYIKYIDEYEVSFDSSKTIPELDEFKEKILKKFPKDKIDKKWEKLSKDFIIDLNINNFTIYNLITEKQLYDYYTIIDNKENIGYDAQVYHNDICNFTKHDIINFCNEMNIISQINHPCIQKFIGYSSNDFNNNPIPTVIKENVYDSLKNIMIFGHPMNYIENDVKGWDGTNKLIVIYGIASAMDFLHRNNIIHRDLKPENIYLDMNLFPKISGFNLCKQLMTDQSEISKHIKGTPIYLAPEIYLEKRYSKSSDVYSFSLIMYEIMTNQTPYSEYMTPKEIKNKICDEQLRPTFNKPIPKIYRDLIERCWSSNPTERPTFNEIITEIKTNPDFLTDSINKEYFFEYIKLLDKYPGKFEPNNRLNEFDDITSKIDTFYDDDANCLLQDMFETETKDLLIDYNYIKLKDYKEKDTIKKGFFYNIEMLREKQTGKQYVQKRFFEKPTFYFKNGITNFRREINIISQLIHPAIIKFIGYIPKHDFYKTPVIITEYASNGDLKKILHSYKENPKINILDDTNKLIVIYGIASAMDFLHRNNIIHRDLKPENIYLDMNLFPKISGFNLCKQLMTDQSEISKHIKGTPIYLAPEIYLEKRYSKSSDVYSFSLIMYEIMTNQTPYSEYMTPKEIKNKICDEQLRPTFNKPIPKIYRDLIERCWSSNPEERPTFNEIITEIKTNPDFLTDSINKEKFQSYIKYINESNISFDPSKKIKPNEWFLSKKCLTVGNFDCKINIRSVDKTEAYNVVFNYDYINLNNFEKQKLIEDNKYYKVYSYKNKETNKICRVKRLKNIDSLNEENLLELMFGLNNYTEINHPSFAKFIGYSPIDFKNRPNPVIITSSSSNGSLQTILELEKKDNHLLDDTKLLIIIYGIAAGMKYLHKLGIIHCNLNPSNIFLNEFLFPMIDGLDKSIKESQVIFFNNLNPSLENYEFEENVFKAPEAHLHDKNIKEGDVYSFAMILYFIITKEIPFSDSLSDYLIDDICKLNLRPKFKMPIQKCYQQLIEKCWSDDPKSRPTFDEIVHHLKTCPEFIIDNVNKDEYARYIDLIEKNQTDKTFCIDDYIESNTNFRKVSIDIKKLKKKSKLNFSISMGAIDLTKFQKIKKIGEGGFGSVYTVIDKETETIYAAKISKNLIEDCDDDDILNLLREIDIISHLKHPAIINYIGYNPNNFKGKPKPVIITEYAPNLSLRNILNKVREDGGNNDWNDTKKLINIYGIAVAMDYLHDLDIIHRDLKPENILLDDHLYPKIADFGLSKNTSNFGQKKIKMNKSIKSSGTKGTVAYLSPEILNDNIYSKKGDIYAYALIVYEIVTNEDPFQNFNIYQLMMNISKGYRPEFKSKIPYCYQKLIEKCWDESMKKRPDFYQIVNLLETDTSFLTPNIDENEFHNYISLIREYQLSIYNIKSDQYYEQEQKNEKEEKTKAQIEFEIVQKENEKMNGIFLDLSKYERKERILKGDIFKIYKIQDKHTGQIYAGQISIFNVRRFTDKDLEELSKDIEKINNLKHPSLLRFIGYSPINFKQKRKPIILTDISSDNTLEVILQIQRDNDKIDKWNDTWKLINIYGIASGMSYLHSNGIIHCYLRPSNIFLDDNLLPQIGDFGLSTKFLDLNKNTHQSITGLKWTPIYSAPEILQKNIYSKASDVYAFAIVMYEILTGEIPFNEINNYNQIVLEVTQGKRPKLLNTIPERFQDLMNKCWAQDPNERPTFDDIVLLLKMDSNFITENINKKDYEKYIKFIYEHLIFSNKPKKLQNIEKIDENNLTTTMLNNDHNQKTVLIDENEQTTINRFISSRNAKELMHFLNDKCENEKTALVFDKSFNKSKDMFLDLCSNGILLNNPVAHYKYAMYLILSKKDKCIKYKEAEKHLKISASQGFYISYFMLSRIYHEFYKDNIEAINYAKEGSLNNDKYSKCLYGYFIAHGIGIEKDFIKGVSIILESQAGDLIDIFSTDIGIYYAELYEEHKLNNNEYDCFAFKSFEKAFSMKQTKATINNYGICFLKGFGVQKDIQKAKEIFEKGILLGDSNSMYHLAFIYEEIDPYLSLNYYKESADNGHIYALSEFAYFNLQINQISDIDSNSQITMNQIITKNEKTDINAKNPEILMKKYINENDTENIYKYFCLLVKSGNFNIPLEYAINLYISKKWQQAYKYFSILSKSNHPIAKYYIGIMTYNGYGCNKNRELSYKILKEIADNGIEKASDFIEEYFNAK